MLDDELLEPVVLVNLIHVHQHDEDDDNDDNDDDNDEPDILHLVHVINSHEHLDELHHMIMLDDDEVDDDMCYVLKRIVSKLLNEKRMHKHDEQLQIEYDENEVIDEQLYSVEVIIIVSAVHDAI